jgi:hypothetical protein
VKRIQYIKNYFDILFIGEKFALFRAVSVARFSGDNLKKEENQIYLLNIYYIARGNSMARAYDDLKRNNLLNSDKKEIA